MDTEMVKEILDTGLAMSCVCVWLLTIILVAFFVVGMVVVDFVLPIIRGLFKYILGLVIRV